MGYSTTQRCKSWNNAFKLRSTGLQMLELAEHINMLCAEHKNFEMSQALRTRSREALSRVPVVYSTRLLKVTLDREKSAYAEALLAEEFSKAELLCFSADVPLTVEIIQDESGRESLFADEITDSAYKSNGGPASSRARVNIGLHEKDQNNICASCE